MEKLKICISRTGGKQMKLDWDKISNNERFLAAMQIIHRCQMCGGCCNNMAGIAYNSVDTARMAKEIGISRNEFIRDYTQASTRKKGDRWLNTVGPNRSCQFWSKEGCTKYAGRGQVCRLYPWTSPEQLNAVRDGKTWHVYAKCPGMIVTYKAVLVAAEKMEFLSAQAIMKSRLGDICILSVVRDTFDDITANYAAKELGLESIPEQDRLKSMAWNYAVAFLAITNTVIRQQDLEEIERNLNLNEEN